MQMSRLALEFKNVSYRYPKADRWALQDINLEVQKNCFLVIAGPTGSGKSTLLKVARGLSKEYGGELHGSVNVLGEDISNLSVTDLGSKLAIVFQNPAYQLHQPRVVDEIMSGPIYQGLPWEECVKRADNIASELLSQDLLEKNPEDLSTGEQQKVALTASLAMQADLLLLDEPFSYLDLVAAQDFVRVIQLLKEKGKTIILSTHNVEPVARLSDRMAVISDGKLMVEGSTEEVLYSHELKNLIGRPLFAEIGDRIYREGLANKRINGWSELAKFFQFNADVDTPRTTKIDGPNKPVSTSIQITDLSYTYPNGNNTIKNLSLSVEKGEVLGIIGRNGSGKTTLAKLILGLLRPTSGNIHVFGKRTANQGNSIASEVGYISQDPADMLFETTVLRECSFGPRMLGLENPQFKAESALSKLDLLSYKDRDPRSLSAGQQRLITLASVLVNDPKILLLDEPEFGLDLKTWRSLVKVIRNLRDEGMTIILIMHNLEAAAFACDRISVMERGKITRTGYVSEIFCDNILVKEVGLIRMPFIVFFRIVACNDIGYISERTFADVMLSKLRSSKKNA